MVLVLDETAKDKIREIKQYAENNPYSMDDLLDIMNGAQEPPGNNAFFSCYIPQGFSVVYTIENQVEGPLRRMSISCNGGLPPVPAVEMLMQEFGFENELQNCFLHMENGGKAINVIEKYNA